VKITIIGSGTMVPSNERNSSGVLIENEGTRSMVDFGYGTLHNLLKRNLTYHDIDRIYITHNHPDHICDLVPFLFASRYPEDPRVKDLEIIAGPGFKQFFDTLMQAFKRWLIPTTFKIRILEQDEETKNYDGLIVTSKKVKHIELSRGYRFESTQGKILAISGDTDYCDEMIDLGKEADLMILECSMPDNMKLKGHLTPTECGKLAKKANCRKLCLTHFYPVCDQKDLREKCSNEYVGELFLAEDLMEFEL
jgi:ribonuclease BN (tRNA processing enzyme)